MWVERYEGSIWVRKGGVKGPRSVRETDFMSGGGLRTRIGTDIENEVFSLSY